MDGAWAAVEHGGAGAPAVAAPVVTEVVGAPVPPSPLTVIPSGRARLLLAHLVEGRWAAALAGDPGAAVLTTDELDRSSFVHEAGGRGDELLAALTSLERHGLIATAGPGAWQATAAGAALSLRLRRAGDELAAAAARLCTAV